MIPVNAKWSEIGTTIISGLDVLSSLVVVDSNTFLTAEFDNHRIMQYDKSGTEGKIVAGGNGNGIRLHQLNHPIGVVIDH
jgi:hypothetical protein